mmetsp:Transcript_46475/g.88740  ORF Transcript_46475/g.88740 Transcript_46475/m.88740 type:complete len:277 (+) Transcript_46475:744-1574(+)
MVKVVGLLRGDLNLFQPLDHAPADVPGDEHAQRVAVVRVQVLAVLLVGEDDVARRVQRRLYVDGRAVRAGPALLVVVRLGELVLGPREAHEAAALLRLGHPSLGQHVSQGHAGPHGGGACSGTPVEPNGSLDLILLLASVARARHQARERDAGHGFNLVHGEGDGLTHVALDGQLVFLPFDLGYCSVVTHDMQIDWGDEPKVQEFRQPHGLAVEGMHAREALHMRMALHPVVCHLFITVVHNRVHGCQLLVVVNIVLFIRLMVILKRIHRFFFGKH